MCEEHFSLCEGVKVIKSVSVHKSGQERLRVSLSVRICEYASVCVRECILV